MVLAPDELIDVATPSGPMRTLVLRPASGAHFPAVLFYSEIFQITAPVRRLAAVIAGHGFTVACPEVYHEHLDAGTVLAYDTAGSDLGNALKYRKPVAAHDADCAALVAELLRRPDANGRVGAMGVCLGGHLAFRAALDRRVGSAACFYATDLHTAKLGGGDDSLARAGDVAGELAMFWGRQDPHVPTAGRMEILNRLNEAGVRLSWHEVNGAHAFLRDEGPRYDPELSFSLLLVAVSLFRRTLGA